ncbi:hypothetical protein [Bacillus salipaludis]|uniref:Uncharacterized protein n=1 Tax=Bacillus salipaludis TaxID=2547811 RepID=A0AA90RA65_9BACI|nr:hypothetical protein [Bacillus salipaludis]MDQ6600378.1 hypothetical protein [Bacillus salipaludis]
MFYLKDPLCFKESILISLEVVSENNYLPVKNFAQSIPSVVKDGRFDTPQELEECIVSCINEFKKTKTYIWLREDFKNILIDVEGQLNKKVSLN